MKQRLRARCQYCGAAADHHAAIRHLEHCYWRSHPWPIDDILRLFQSFSVFGAGVARCRVLHYGVVARYVRGDGQQRFKIGCTASLPKRMLKLKAIPIWLLTVPTSDVGFLYEASAGQLGHNSFESLIHHLCRHSRACSKPTRCEWFRMNDWMKSLFVGAADLFPLDQKLEELGEFAPWLLQKGEDGCS